MIFRRLWSKLEVSDIVNQILRITAKPASEESMVRFSLRILMLMNKAYYRTTDLRQTNINLLLHTIDKIIR